MEKFFNTAGPMNRDDHYCIDPLTRVDWTEIQSLIDEKQYFVIHAPRQTGKTSALYAIMRELNESGAYACAYANIEAAQVARGDVIQGIPTVCSVVSRAIAMRLQLPELQKWYLEEGKNRQPQDQLSQLLSHWALISDKPTVLLLDEVDALVGDTLISLLRQIRAGYADRPGAFPHSVVLCGVRDVRDYRINQSGGEVITGGSAFNIKTKSLRMENFSRDEIYDLWMQHTKETGQEIKNEIYPELWEDTYGQPWLVNALGDELTRGLRPCRDRNHAIDLSDYKEARESLILSRATHLDQLAARLSEPRVINIMKEILVSEEDAIRAPEADIEYTSDLGLIRTSPSIRISNRIYSEIIPRELSWSTQVMISTQEQAWYIGDGRRLKTDKLLSAFQQFFRTHSDVWSEGFNYKEAAPQLLLQAFLQRIVNGGGIISREYGLGRKRTDLFVEWPLNEQMGARGPLQRIVIEIKLLRGDLSKIMEAGLDQVADYARRSGADEAHLLIFDRGTERSWDEKIWRRDAQSGGTHITVWGV